MNPVEASFERAAERGGDITDPVYARLFAEHPETQAMFWRDNDGSIRAEMLARVIEAVLDFADRRYTSPGLIRTEVLRHANEIDTPPELFEAFFAVLRDTVRDACGSDWTPVMEAAWAGMLVELDGYVRRVDA